MKKEVVVFGLGKMGTNVARRLASSGWKVVGYNRTSEDTKNLAKEIALTPVYSFKEIVENTKGPRIIWFMIPAGEVLDEILFGDDGLAALLDKGDFIIDAGNSYYKDAIRRFSKLNEMGIKFVDVGFSGGPEGALNGGCLMVGGESVDFEVLKPLLEALSITDGLAHFQGIGAGHFVKMIHNGIEYGMMQSLAEGFTLMANSDYKLDLEKVAEIYNHGSVVESRLVGWLKDAFLKYGKDLSSVSGSVAHTGEGEWTVKEAKEQGVSVKVIEDSFNFRVESEKKPSFTGKLLSAMRNRFGGHSIK